MTLSVPKSVWSSGFGDAPLPIKCASHKPPNGNRARVRFIIVHYSCCENCQSYNRSYHHHKPGHKHKNLIAKVEDGERTASKLLFAVCTYLYLQNMCSFYPDFASEHAREIQLTEATGCHHVRGFMWCAEGQHQRTVKKTSDFRRTWPNRE